ncbi:DUF4214 domain-containing protein [Herbaspirillum sp. HC18]|nr:DUF4214 domain-containing protein [Herbaspirillum sp. HC18]
MTTSEISQAISRLYIAAFQRAPELGGYQYWIQQAQISGLAQTLNSIFTLPVVQGIYAASLSNADFVTAIYNNVFNKLPDSGGLAYWSQQLNSTGRGELVYNMISAGLGTPLGTPGRDVIVNRVDHAISAVNIQINGNVELDASSLSSQYKTITSSASTVEAASSSMLATAIGSTPAFKASVNTYATFSGYPDVIYHSNSTHNTTVVNHGSLTLGNSYTSGIKVYSYSDKFNETTFDFLALNQSWIKQVDQDKLGNLAIVAGDVLCTYEKGANTYNVTSLKSASKATDHINTVQVLANGNIAIAGDENSYANGRDAFVAILDKSGHVIAQARYEKTGVVASDMSFSSLIDLPDGRMLARSGTYSFSGNEYYVLDSNLNITNVFSFKGGDAISTLLSNDDGTYIALANNVLAYLDKDFKVTGTAALKFAGDASYSYTSFQDIAQFNGHLYAIASAPGVSTALLEFNGTKPGSTVIDAKVITDRNGYVKSFDGLAVDGGLAYLVNNSSDALAIVPHGSVTPNLSGDFRVNNIANLVTGTLTSGTQLNSYGIAEVASTTILQGSGTVSTYHDLSLIGVPTTNTAFHFDSSTTASVFSMGTLV